MEATSNPYVAKALQNLEEIYTALRMNDIMLSKSEAMKIVGGRYVLERLVATGKIRMKKTSEKDNGKWFCNAEDVFRYAGYKGKRS